MFKKILQSLSRPAAKSPAPAPAKPSIASGPLAPAGGGGGKSNGILGRIAKGESVATDNPDQLCGINAGMTKDEITARLKLLYRRYNRSAGSLNAATRAEADKMLDAIVAAREKHIGRI